MHTEPFQKYLPSFSERTEPWGPGSQQSCPSRPSCSSCPSCQSCLASTACTLRLIC